MATPAANPVNSSNTSATKKASNWLSSVFGSKNPNNAALHRNGVAAVNQAVNVGTSGASTGGRRRSRRKSRKSKKSKKSRKSKKSKKSRKSRKSKKSRKC